MTENQLQPKITYFDVRGRAEVIRLLLEYTGTAYKERRITLEEWPLEKAAFPLGQLPVYEQGELFINQSHAIYRHLARKYDLYGDSESERIR
ncbi:MAG: glutathione S-transferase N-terminal domain-containing protein, partial [Gammaproteobacteria bacterium]